MDVQVSANQMFNSNNGGPANFTLPAGKTGTITASGTWVTHWHGPNTPGNGPGGNGVPNHGQYPCPGFESCMVIFYSPEVPPGQRAPTSLWNWFKSDNDSFAANAPGIYYFAANDDTSNNASAYNDNKGIITVHVNIA
jgi:hypothetical protein